VHINTHVSVGIILSMIYYLFIRPTPFEVILLFCFSFLIDFDFLFSRFAENRNHRVLPTHGVIIYLGLLPIGVFFPIFTFLGTAGIIHVLIDCIDWGVAILSPISKKIYFGLLPKPSDEVINEPSLKKRQCWFTLTYYRSKFIIIIDVALMIASIIILFLVNPFYWWFILVLSFFLVIHLLSYFRCKKQTNK